MGLTLPAFDIISNHLNRLGLLFDPAKQDLFFAEEIDAIRGRLVQGIYSINGLDLYLGGLERISPTGEMRARLADLEPILTPATPDGRVWYDDGGGALAEDIYGVVAGVTLSLTGGTGSGGVVGRLATGVSVDLNSAALQTVYTVPAGESAVIMAIVARDPDGAVAAPFKGGFGFDGAGSDVVGPIKWIELDATNKTKTFHADAGAVQGAAASVLSFQSTILNGSARTALVDVIGFLT